MDNDDICCFLSEQCARGHVVQAWLFEVVITEALLAMLCTEEFGSALFGLDATLSDGVRVCARRRVAQAMHLGKQ